MDKEDFGGGMVARRRSVGHRGFSAGHQGFSAGHWGFAPDEYDDGGGQGGPYLLAALFAFLRYVGVEAHGASAYPTELRVLVPVEQFVALACLQVFRFRQLVVALAQRAHFVAVRPRQGLFRAVALVAVHVKYGGPGLDVRGWLGGYGISVRCTFQYEVALAEGEVSHGFPALLDRV